MLNRQQITIWTNVSLSFRCIYIYIYIYIHHSVLIIYTFVTIIIGNRYHLNTPVSFWLIGHWEIEWNFRHEISKQILVIDDWVISCGIALTWKPQDLADDKIDGRGISCEIALIWMSLDFTDDQNIGSGNGLVPLGNKPLPEPRLTQFSVAIWHH